jgi:CFEM domain
MLGQAQALGCDPTNVACLCANQDFGFGVRDCTAESCPPDVDLSGIQQYADQYCSGGAACKSSMLSPSSTQF